MGDKKTCLRCGGTNLQPGDVQSTGKIYARPHSAKLATVFLTGALVNADICFDCGHVELAVDTNKAKSLRKNASM